MASLECPNCGRDTFAIENTAAGEVRARCQCAWNVRAVDIETVIENIHSPGLRA